VAGVRGIWNTLDNKNISKISADSISNQVLEKFWAKNGMKRDEIYPILQLLRIPTVRVTPPLNC
jgi:hypothetical protein